MAPLANEQLSAEVVQHSSGDVFARDHDRLIEFLQEDHVRLYGLDLKERIERAGFACEVLSSAQLSSEARTRYAADARFYREIFLCRRQAAAQYDNEANATAASQTDVP